MRVPVEIILSEPALTLDYVRRLREEIRRLAEDNKRNVVEIESLRSRVDDIEDEFL